MGVFCLIFEGYKNALDHRLVLHHFDPKLATVLVTDASRIGLGYLLYQEIRKETPKKRLILCVSGAESRYAVCEVEGLAISWVVRKTMHYLAGMPEFTVSTVWKNIPGVSNPELRKYLEDLQEYNFNIKYIKGQDNIIAYILSRNPM